jgi:drug/metabolite transporter (DMT)-like permease
MTSPPTPATLAAENGRAIAFMLVAMVGFILNDSLIKIVSERLPLGEIMLFRSLFAILFLLILCIANGAIRQLHLLFHPLVGLRVVAEVTGTLLYLTALFQLPIANATAILQVLPLMITAGAALFLGAPVGWRRWSAIGVGFAGVLLIMRPGMSGFDQWSLVALAGVACMAVRDLTTSRLPRHVPTYGVSLATLVGVAFAGLSLRTVETWLVPEPMDVLFLAGSAGFILVGFVFVINAMRLGDISFVAPFRYSIIVWAIVIGYLVWGDVPDALTITGIAVLVATGLYSLMRERKIMRKPGPAARADLPVRPSALAGPKQPERGPQNR